MLKAESKITDVIIEKFLKHLGLWEMKQRPPQRANAPLPNIYIDSSSRPGATRCMLSRKLIFAISHA